MSSVISGNYRELTPAEIPAIVRESGEAWKHVDIPRRQWEFAAKPELEKFRNSQPVAPFDALVRCLKRLPMRLLAQRPRLLDIGASSGYYREVLEIAGFNFDYSATDFSPAFKELALELYPDIDFLVTDATSLPFHDDFYEVVLSAANIMHIPNYKLAIHEAVRVSRQYLILHRTPVFSGKATTCFEKEAYGVRCLEWAFNEAELFRILVEEGLSLLYETNIFYDEGFGHKSYLLRKKPGLPHYSV